MTDAKFSRVRAVLLSAVIAVALFGVVTFTYGTVAQAQTGTLGGKTIVLDPGHGGSDYGASFRYVDAANPANNVTLYEKDQSLNVAYRLKTLLEAADATVYMTRGGDPSNPSGPNIKDADDDAFADDATLSNNDRYTYANKTGANILVSIHMNGSYSPDTDYTTTLFGNWRKDKKLATTLYGQLRTLPAATGSGTIQGKTPYSYASGVLLKSDMPATIAESVFITNKYEGSLLYAGRHDLAESARQQQIAQKLRDGIVDYFNAGTSSP